MFPEVALPFGQLDDSLELQATPLKSVVSLPCGGASGLTNNDTPGASIVLVLSLNVPDPRMEEFLFLLTPQYHRLSMSLWLPFWAEHYNSSNISILLFYTV